MNEPATDGEPLDADQSRWARLARRAGRALGPLLPGVTVLASRPLLARRPSVSPRPGFADRTLLTRRAVGSRQAGAALLAGRTHRALLADRAGAGP